MDRIENEMKVALVSENDDFDEEMQNRADRLIDHVREHSMKLGSRARRFRGNEKRKQLHMDYRQTPEYEHNG
jgi:hypothetical protein